MSEMLWLLPLLWAGSQAQDERLRLTVQTPVMVQEGLCVFVPCTFTHPGRDWNHLSPAYGYWFQGGANINQDAAVVTNNPARNVQEETQGRFHLLGDPQTKNCSLDIRDDHGTNLTCQVHFPAAGVTVETTIQLNVTCARQNHTPGGCSGVQKPYKTEMLWLLPLLWAGSLAKDERYTLTVQTPVTVQEGLCVFVPCTFTHPWSYRNHPIDAYGYWFQERADKKRGAAVVTNNPSHKVQEETQGRFHLLGDPHTNNCSLDIRDAKRTDDGSYFFRMEKTSYPKDKYSYVESKLTVRVTALNHTPNILIWETLESGLPRNLTCSVPWACEWGTPPIFSWTSAAHSSLGPRTHLSSVLTLTPRPQDHGTNLTCQVHFPATGVTVETTIQLNVTCATQNLTPGGCLGDSAGGKEPSVMGH
ncbi:PREDICTED: myeloid cell surface antigen CD33 [Myotis davidii]|uniref:myeloid cell surface antigen CD33 n=1 Tax=Myotis davidii TaxID=225400 RepID=UPI000767CA86|nr:PREDICTED: myeloid cell surface antigen CD33 [Myotis davidii]